MENKENFKVLDYLDEEIFVYSYDKSIKFMNKAMIKFLGADFDGKDYDSVFLCVNENYVFSKNIDLGLDRTFKDHEFFCAVTKEYRLIKEISLQDGYTMVKFRNTTREKKNEIELKNFEERQNIAEKMIKIGNWVLSLPQGEIYWSEELYRICEIDPNSLSASYELFLSLVHPDDREKVDLAYKNFVETKLSYDLTFRLLLENGKIKYVQEKSYAEFDKNEESTRLIGLLLDITEQKQTEFSLKRSKNRINAFIKQLPEPITITDENGVIIEVNESFKKMYGYEDEELIGKNPNLVNSGRSTYQSLGYEGHRYDELFKNMWKDIKNPEIGWWEGTVINRKKSKELIWARLRVNTIFDENNKVLYHMGQPVDITPMIETKKLDELEFYRTISAMAEIRDNETGKHMRRVGYFAKLIARKLGRPKIYCDDIEMFAPMHDIGKIGIADSILLAPRKLTAEEFEVMKGHTIIGYEIMKNSKRFKMAAEIVLNHHEHWDGKGYPANKKGTEIPFAARIAAIADVYDALRCERPYKGSWNHQKALDYIKSKRGMQFDPDILDAFVSISDKIEHLYTELE